MSRHPVAYVVLRQKEIRVQVVILSQEANGREFTSLGLGGVIDARLNEFWYAISGLEIRLRDLTCGPAGRLFLKEV